MKMCSKCKLIKDFSCFSKKSKSKDGLAHKCKECQSLYWKAYYKTKEKGEHHRAKQRINKKIMRKEIHNYLVELKHNKMCVDCKLQYPHWVLEFDHVPERGKKRFCVSGATGCWKTFLDEIQKCDLICANCHKERTYKRQQSETGSDSGPSALEAEIARCKS